MEGNFWTNEKWLEHTKKISPKFVEELASAKNINWEIETLTLVVDGVRHELGFNGVKPTIKIIR